MPQIQLRRDDNAHFNDHLPVHATVHERSSSPAAMSLPSHPAVDDSMAFAFQRLHLVLAIAAQGYAEGNAAERDALLNAANSLDVFRHKAAIERLKDPVIKCLSDALTEARQAYDRHAGIRADALRLAVAIRLLGLQAGNGSSMDDGSVFTAPAEQPVGGLQKWRLRRVAEYVESHLSKKITLSDLAAVAGLSRMHFASQFRIATGLRPHEYLLRQRIRRADELLRHTTMTIVEVALSVGFQTQAHFTTVFKRIAGSTPAQWRNTHYVIGQGSQ
ncbi:helix-turn-helix transcriptional regulator [Bradyrhizobium sp. BRP22]|uniref:helix-turn-helix domain-containing protein n=1 Tax=Bradyrhizobium sp. BRP22 TaxID=2793821 RepID=UPI001CD7AE2E|nr:AraC family transcriptional regulator [Bradyrhizobium sp. BRP22]MCA1452593.1 helix-turn-helix transcriptional regulator [Bradyrhizobium sp. BRP22]